LLDGPSWESAERRWMVLYTKPRQEKSLSRDLLKHEMPFYLPLVRKTHQYAQRTVSSHSPLFAGYVFFYGTEIERGRTLATNRVLRVLEVEDPQQLVHDLRQFHQLIQANAPLTIEARLQPGDRVRVRKGPFEGVEGVVLNRRGQMRLLVSINFLQQGASVEIEDFLLEPLP
jgi:transcription antitermination factor NusG